jgi:hypothetical protein
MSGQTAKGVRDITQSFTPQAFAISTRLRRKRSQSHPIVYAEGVCKSQPGVAATPGFAIPSPTTTLKAFANFLVYL